MNAPTQSFLRPSPGDARKEPGGQMARQWAAVQEAAVAIAMLAGLAREEPSTKARRFTALVRELDEGRQELVANRVSDLAAIMQPGLAALLAVNARGQDATAAALTLWREYHASREALLALLPDTGTMGPFRSA